MPNIETLMDSISQIITNYKTEPAEQIYFSTIDLKYAYSQLNLHPETANHCNFNIISGDMTGTYRFKTDFAKQQISWLGYNITQSGISPLESKTSSIMSLQPPNTLKKLRSFLGSVHYISKFIPNLAQLCHPLRPLLRKSTKYIWTDTHILHLMLLKLA